MKEIEKMFSSARRMATESKAAQADGVKAHYRKVQNGVDAYGRADHTRQTMRTSSAPVAVAEIGLVSILILPR
jgi:uncharacterized phage protein gp47/JayE